MKIEEIINEISCPPYNFHLDVLGDGWYLQIYFDVAGEVQKGRKWYISSHSTESEIVQTAFKAVLTAEEHEIRERFLYAGEAPFSPHFDIWALVGVANAKLTDRRKQRPT